MASKIFILIPTHNRAQLLENCLEAIKKQTYKNYQTIVINDGSIDETQKVISSFPKTIQLLGSGNLWWTGAMRLGVKHALLRSKPGDFILLMNDDTEFEKEYLQTLLDDSKSSNRAIITSVALDINNKSKYLETGVNLDWAKDQIFIKNKLSPSFSKSNLTEVNTACGRGTLVPIEVFLQLDNFNKRLPHYLADYEFVTSAKNHGFNVYISKSCQVFATAKAGGIRFTPGKKVSPSQLATQLFSKRSKSNIINQLIFITSVCPAKFKPVAYYNLLRQFLFQIKHISLTSNYSD